MKRNRILVLSSLALIASGALIFACGGGDDNDAGTDSGTKDAKTDTTTTFDAKNDTTTTDTGTDTGNDASDAGSDASDASDAQSDAGAGLTFMVLRAGGTVDAGADAALSSAATQVFLEERNVSDGSLVRTIPLPTAVNGNNQPLTISGSATSEGTLTNSADGHYVIIGGYAAAPGTAGIAKKSTDGGVLRLVARVDVSGNIDTTTELAAYDGNNIRSATSDDGGTFWTGGSSAADAGNTGNGVQYVTLGSTGASTTVGSPPTNTRVVAIYGGQLFVSSAFTPNNGISAVGTGEPTTASTTTLLNGFGGDSGLSPYEFAMLDQDAAVAGLDTLYVADDDNPDAGGGIQKWVFDGTKWTNIATFINGLGGKGFFGVTAFPTSSGVILIATVNATSGTQIIKYVDDGVNTPTASVLATSVPGTSFRGVAHAPQ